MPGPAVSINWGSGAENIKYFYIAKSLQISSKFAFFTKMQFVKKSIYIDQINNYLHTCLNYIDLIDKRNNAILLLCSYFNQFYWEN